MKMAAGIENGRKHAIGDEGSMCRGEVAGGRGHPRARHEGHRPHHQSNGKTIGHGGRVKSKCSGSADRSRIWVVDRWWYRKGNTGDLHTCRALYIHSKTHSLDQPRSGKAYLNIPHGSPLD